MEALISSLLHNTRMGTEEEVMLVLLLAFLPLLLFFTFRAKAGHRVTLRPIPGYALLKELLARALETGQSLHLSMGTAGVGGAATAETLAGLAVLEHLADQPAVGYVSPLVTVAHPTLLPVAQDVMRRGHEGHGHAEGYDPTRIRLIAPQPVAYAAGVMDILEHEDLAANVMIGSFGDEFLLMGETGAKKGVTQIAGAVDPRTLPFIFASVDHTLLGEEIFAAGAYLSARAAHMGSLRAQDWMRWIIVAAIIGGVVWKSLGLP
ncbi:MAG: DUF6754 domain-containing protein [Anaerolineae bacterium]